jgi:hypothetical protein
MTTTSDTRAARLQADIDARQLAANTAIAKGFAASLRDLAAFIQANPSLVEHMQWSVGEILVPIGTADNPGHTLDLFAAAADEMRNRADVYSKDADHAGLLIHFGSDVTLQVYARREALAGHLVAELDKMHNGRPLSIVRGAK